MYGFKENDNYFEKKMDEVYAITDPEVRDKELISLHLQILLERRNTLDFRHEAAEYMNIYAKENPKLVIPKLINFLESEEAQLSNPDEKKIGYRLMPYPNKYRYNEQAVDEFSEIKREVLYAFDPEFPETKEAVPILIDIILKEFFKKYIITVIYTLLRLSELHQDVRYIVYTKLQDVGEYNFAAKLLLEQMDILFNRFDGYEENFCDNFMEDFCFEEKYKERFFL
ncbi:MAG: hypothetical protein JXA54_13795 [Candidatus Heimdallarchaeota archaeon]|nr:hypothetical protein [Candidatus Heimdallarchaeota archaeon]